MIEPATCLSLLKEAAIMAMDSSTVEQMVSPAQVWRHLPPDLQVHIVRLVAHLATYLVLAEREHSQPLGKETADALSSLTQQDPA